jgi:hypothetical protein
MSLRHRIFQRNIKQFLINVISTDISISYQMTFLSISYDKVLIFYLLSYKNRLWFDCHGLCLNDTENAIITNNKCPVLKLKSLYYQLYNNNLLILITIYK